MLISAESLNGYRIAATDGVIGQVQGFFFDDRSWTIRYLVVDTGTWIPGRKVLIAPAVLGRPDGSTRTLPVGLTREQIKNSPDIDTEKTVSRQKQIELHNHYGWAPYWIPGSFEDLPPAVPPLPPTPAEGRDVSWEENDPHLRGTREIIDYRIRAADGEIGHVEDFIVDDEGWTVRYVVVDTGTWLPGRKVLMPPSWITEIAWSDESVSVDVSREAVRNSPRFDPAAPVNREYEERLYDYYGRPRYWKGRDGPPGKGEAA